MFLINQVIIFTVGASLASFAVLVGMRVPAQTSVIFPRSYCDHCSQTLAVEDLVPVLSYFINGGHSRCCRQPLSFLYFIFEFIGGSSALIIYYILVENYRPELAWQLLLTSFFGIIFTVSDLQTFTLPNSVMKFFLLFSFLYQLLFYGSDIGWTTLGSLGLFSVLLALYIMKPGSLGAGDVKLMVVFSLLYGLTETILIVFLASGLGILFFIFSLVIRRGKSLKKLPFGVFLFFSAGVILLLDSVFLSFF